MDKIQKIMARRNALLPLSERDRELLSRRFTIDFNYNTIVRYNLSIWLHSLRLPANEFFDNLTN